MTMAVMVLLVVVSALVGAGVAWGVLRYRLTHPRPPLPAIHAIPPAQRREPTRFYLSLWSRDLQTERSTMTIQAETYPAFIRKPHGHGPDTFYDYLEHQGELVLYRERR